MSLKWVGRMVQPPARRLMITKSNIQDSSSAVIPDADFSDPNQKVILQIVRMQLDAGGNVHQGKGIWNFTSPKFNSDLVATNWWSLMTIYSIALYIYIIYKYINIYVHDLRSSLWTTCALANDITLQGLKVEFATQINLTSRVKPRIADHQKQNKN